MENSDLLKDVDAPEVFIKKYSTDDPIYTVLRCKHDGYLIEKDLNETVSVAGASELRAKVYAYAEPALEDVADSIPESDHLALLDKLYYKSPTLDEQILTKLNDDSTDPAIRANYGLTEGYFEEVPIGLRLDMAKDENLLHMTFDKTLQEYKTRAATDDKIRREVRDMALQSNTNLYPTVDLRILEGTWAIDKFESTVSGRKEHTSFEILSEFAIVESSDDLPLAKNTVTDIVLSVPRIRESLRDGVSSAMVLAPDRIFPSYGLPLRATLTVQEVFSGNRFSLAVPKAVQEVLARETGSALLDFRPETFQLVRFRNLTQGSSWQWICTTESVRVPDHRHIIVEGQFGLAVNDRVAIELFSIEQRSEDSVILEYRAKLAGKRMYDFSRSVPTDFSSAPVDCTTYDPVAIVDPASTNFIFYITDDVGSILAVAEDEEDAVSLAYVWKSQDHPVGAYRPFDLTRPTRPLDFVLIGSSDLADEVIGADGFHPMLGLRRVGKVKTQVFRWESLSSLSSTTFEVPLLRKEEEELGDVVEVEALEEFDVVDHYPDAKHTKHRGKAIQVSTVQGPQALYRHLKINDDEIRNVVEHIRSPVTISIDIPPGTSNIEITTSSNLIKPEEIQVSFYRWDPNGPKAWSFENNNGDTTVLTTRPVPDSVVFPNDIVNFRATVTDSSRTYGVAEVAVLPNALHGGAVEARSIDFTPLTAQNLRSVHGISAGATVYDGEIIMTADFNKDSGSFNLESVVNVYGSSYNDQELEFVRKITGNNDLTKEEVEDALRTWLDNNKAISADHLPDAKTITGDSSLTLDTATSAVQTWSENKIGNSITVSVNGPYTWTVTSTTTRIFNIKVLNQTFSITLDPVTAHPTFAIDAIMKTAIISFTGTSSIQDLKISRVIEGLEDFLLTPTNTDTKNRTIEVDPLEGIPQGQGTFRLKVSDELSDELSEPHIYDGQNPFGVLAFNLERFEVTFNEEISLQNLEDAITFDLPNAQLTDARLTDKTLLSGLVEGIREVRAYSSRSALDQSGTILGTTTRKLNGVSLWENLESPR